MKIIIGQGYLVLNNAEEVYPVELFFKGDKLKKGYAYIKDDIVYIYRGRLKKTADSSIPGIYKTESGYKFVKPSKKEIESTYSVDRVISLNVPDIIDKISGNVDDYQQPEDIEIINNNSELYVPTIKEDDDFLKKIIKQAIIDKRINLRNYRALFPNDYALNNMKSALKRETKMTVPNFVAWCEILGISWEIVLSDNGKDNINPLPKPIIYNSEDWLTFQQLDV